MRGASRIPSFGGYRPDRMFLPLGDLGPSEFGVEPTREAPALKLLRLSFDRESDALKRANSVNPIQRALKRRLKRADADVRTISSAILPYQWFSAPAHEPLARVQPGVTQLMIDIQRPWAPVLAIATIKDAAWIRYRAGNRRLWAGSFAGDIGLPPKSRSNGLAGTIDVAIVTALSGLADANELARLLRYRAPVGADVLGGIWITW